MHTTPVSLLERLRQPDEQAAWEQFVELFTPFLYHCARRLGLRAGDAADLVQDVFTTLVKKLPEFTYDRDRSFRAWLRTVTLNKFRENCRRRAASVPEAGAPLPEELAAPGAVEAFDEAEYCRHLTARALEIMQAQFQPTTRKACWEHIVVGRPAAEVAAELGISEGAVYSATHRVLRRLRQELEGLLD
jgi:RNA polymerase sigma-70 factor (ECF subfamily)